MISIKKAFCLFALILPVGPACPEAAKAETASVSGGCADLSLSSSEPGPGGDYFIDAEGSITGGYYYMAYLYMDGALLQYKSSFWGSSFSFTGGPFSGEHTFRLDARGGGSHGICSSSVELKTGAGKDPAEMAAGICEAVKKLPGEAFKNNPDQRKNALCNKLDEVATLVDYAVNSTDPVIRSQFYVDAIEKMHNDVSAKMDGGYGGHPKDDWITDSGDQSSVYPMAEALIKGIQERL